MFQSICILVFIVLPTLVSINLTIFNCYDLFGDNRKYLMTDLSVECWKGDHDYYSKRFGFPTVLIWIIGCPIILIIVLARRKRFLAK